MIRALVWSEVQISPDGVVHPHIATVPGIKCRQIPGTPRRLRVGQAQVVRVECDSSEILEAVGYAAAVVTRPNGTRHIRSIKPIDFTDPLETDNGN